MSLLGNIIWIIFGGLISFLLYMVGGVALCLTIVGIPFGMQAFKLGVAMLAPFGRTTRELPDANSPLRVILNALWIVTFGATIAINHLVWAACLAISIIGLPFAVQHLKMIPLCLLPFGREFS
jgi:uncharacterized membrane protein YccF (DUF307 family)